LSTTVEQIANAILYEGYILYPYRPSSVKNQQRWNFGLVYPRNCAAGPSVMQTECLLRGSAGTRLKVRIRFLHLVTRRVMQPDSRFVASAEIDGQVFRTWQEAVERAITLPDYLPADTVQSHREPFRFVPDIKIEQLTNREGQLAGFLHRQSELLEGTVEVASKEVEPGVYRVTARILNQTELHESCCTDHESVVLQSLVSAHTILNLTDGNFISLLEPPDELRVAAVACQNVGTWPVLAGEKEQHKSMLSSPIILYDYPEVAPESPGELFDGTEIDEILTLRIMTMTDPEKEEMRHSDERARRILERTESLPPENLAKLHGALRRHL
jgi:hypothetical protein